MHVKTVLILVLVSLTFQISWQDEPEAPKINILIGNSNGFEGTLYLNVKKEDITLSELPLFQNGLENLTSELKKSDVLHQYHYEIRCIASFPVEFTYEGEGTPQVMTSSYRHIQLQKNPNGLEDFQNASNYLFETRLILKPRETNTGKYICKSLLNDYQDNHVYIYVPGPEIFIADKPETLGVFGPPAGDLNNDVKAGNANPGNKVGLTPKENVREQLFLGPHSSGSLLLIPCAISNPSGDIVVRLYEKTSEGGKTSLKDLTYSSKFYPKQGFLLKPENSPGSTSLSNFSREFKCEAFETSETLKNSKNSKFMKEPTRLTSLNASISYVLLPTFNNVTLGINYKAKEPNHIFSCDVFPEDQMVFFGRKDCYSPMDCKLLESRLRKSYLPRIMTNRNGSLSLSYRTLFTQIPDSRLGIGGQRTGSVLPISGIFFCSCGRNRMKAMIYNSFGHSVVTDFTKKPDVTDLLKIILLEDVNESLTLMCIGRSFFYSQGFVWALEMEDGTKEFLIGEELQLHSPFIKSKLVLSSTNYTIGNKVTSSASSSTNSDDMDMVTTRKVKIVHCYAPILESGSQWDNVSISTAEGLGNNEGVEGTFEYGNGSRSNNACNNQDGVCNILSIYLLYLVLAFLGCSGEMS